MVFARKISKNFAFELGTFQKLRSFKDGITFFQFECELDLYESDHKPSFELMFVFFNFIVFDFNIYNVNHVIKDDMGLFDTLKCKMKFSNDISSNMNLIGIDLNKLEYQTKDFDCSMGSYFINESGKLFEDCKTYEWMNDTSYKTGGYLKVVSSEVKPYDFLGKIRFYTSIDHMENDVWIEFEAKCIDGIIVSLKLVEAKSESNVQRKKDLKEFLEKVDSENKIKSCIKTLRSKIKSWLIKLSSKF